MSKNYSNKLMIIAGIFTFLLFPVASCSKKGSSNSQNNTSSVKTISSMNELNQLINENGSKMLVLDLYADWCMPCKILSPIFNSLSEEYKDQAVFFKVDIDKNPDIAAAFGVRGIPYVVFIRNKKAIYALSGVNPKESYEKVLNSCYRAESADACAQLLEPIHSDR